MLLETTANWLAGRAMHAAHLQVDQRAPQFLQPFAGPSWVKAELMTPKDLATSQRFWTTYFFADFVPQIQDAIHVPGSYFISFYRHIFTLQLLRQRQWVQHQSIKKKKHQLKANAAGPVPFVLDLRIAHDRFGNSSDPTLNGTLHYPNPNDIDKSLNDTTVDKIRKYHTDYNNNPPNAISFMPTIVSTSDRLRSEFIRVLFLQVHRETDRFFAASGVQSVDSNLGSSYSHFRHATFSSMMKSKCGNILAKAAALRINLNLDGSPITSQSHTHPSHSQTSRLLVFHHTDTHIDLIFSFRFIDS